MSAPGYARRTSRVKVCRTCRETKHYALFERSAKTGRPLRCRACVTEEARLDALRYPDGQKLCPRCNTAKPTEAFGRNIRDPKGLNSYCKACATANARKWSRGHQERYLLNAARARARAAGLECTLTADDIKIPTACPVLGLPISAGGGRGFQWSSPSLDRVDPRQGYTISNVRVVSFRANSVKSDGTAAEHRAIADYIEREAAPVDLDSDPYWWAA